MMHMTNLVTTTPIPGSDNWHTAVVTVTPETADELLKGNIGNRKLSKSSVAKYAAAMRAGAWKASPEPLIVAPTGRLLNGQTRLHAVKATGIPQKFLFIFGVQEDVFSVLDRGRTRSLADAHRMDKETAEVARLLAQITFSSAGGGAAVNDHDFLRAAAVVGDVQRNLRDQCATKARYFGTAPFRTGAVLRILTGANEAYVSSTYRNLNRGHVESLPPVGAAAVRMVMTGKWGNTTGHAASMDMLARAWYVFNPEKKDRNSFRGLDTHTAVSEMRSLMLRAVEDSDNV